MSLLSPPRALAASTGADVARAFKRAFVSQLHPNMLFAVLLPFLIALLGSILLLWLFWTPLTDWLRLEASQWDLVNRLDEWLVAIGLFSLKLYLVPLVAAAILLPVSGILGLAIAAVFVMPLVLRHVTEREYAGLARQGTQCHGGQCLERHLGQRAVCPWMVADSAVVAGAAHGAFVVRILVGVCIYTDAAPRCHC